jgi:hypothetical protein
VTPSTPPELRVVLDTQVLLRGAMAKSSSLTSKIYDAWRDGPCLLLLSEPRIQEIEDVVARPEVLQKLWFSGRASAIPTTRRAAEKPLSGGMHMLAGWRRMAKHIEVIYTHGVFRPAAPLELELAEGQHLTLILPENGVELEPFVEDDDLRKWCAERAGEQVPSLEDVRRTLSKIPGSMADVVIAERDERL